MRERKYRAWIGNRMEYDVVVGRFGAYYAALDTRDTSSLVTTRYSDDIPVMEFTGLLDLKGKEIYEGDVLRDDQGDVFDVRFGNLPLDKSGDCVCKYQAFYAHYEKTVNGRTGFGHECNEIREWMEIIGNIYSNPELLKELS